MNLINKEALEYYNNGAEIGRLERGIGKIEFERTKEIILRYLPKNRTTIYDVGGGVGIYSRWLAELGHEVHLIELSPNAVECAKNINSSTDCPIYSLEVGDARNIDRSDESADIVLLMGPMYHLINIEDRLKALNEAKRVLKKDGLLVCAGITRYGSMLWAISVYGSENKILDEVEFVNMIRGEIKEGHHIRPDIYPSFIARSYFHLPKEFEDEIRNAGFIVEKTLAVEGPTWIVPTLDTVWKSEDSKKTILDMARMVEEDENIMAMSPHFLNISIKK
ncbi:bifunctional 2-polyprenyl-6-hydroxyphenol methylase/3-demethylubiquinol 3-O-methyltransferase UbiG [Clostridium sp. CF012]|uniref:class I SAM-dependent methyltransferase n=1 Tax=Clostridium sp. CF012 TaxID=2843319 RepID=UPI001C0D5538|nr:class I SAM-dependent methyltransferase [Clostridium sp. CF012]MBU3146756.1 class I SAM-dependent methyltransferase [Clostridium sp. CF012]